MTEMNYSATALCVCGSEITKFFKSGKPHLYCGAKCNQIARTLRRNPAAILRPTLLGRACTCKGCGKSYENKRGGTTGEGSQYCSRACAYADISKWRVTPNIGLRKEKQGASCAVFFKVCAHCSKSFATRWEKKDACSPECAYARDLRRMRDGYEPIVRVTKTCGCCGKNFESSSCGRFCSGKCANKSRPRNHRKRARHFGVDYEPVDRLKVFDRDGWRCQICSKRTPRKKLGMMVPDAPELDHRIPLSIGGGHLYSNVQCACRRCNGDKGNKSSTGQLPMFDA